MEMLGPPRVTALGDGVPGTTVAWTELGSGPPLVLLHGLTDSHRTWRRVAPRLARHFRVYMPDLPGHGLSGRPDAPYTIDWYAQTMLRWLDAVGLERAHVIGHSFGGGVAQAMLLEARARIDRMVLVAPGGLGPEVGLGLRLAAFPVLGPILAPTIVRMGVPIAMRVAANDFASPEPEEIERLAWMNNAPGSGMAFRRTVTGCIDLFGQTEQTWDRIHRIHRTDGADRVDRVGGPIPFAESVAPDEGLPPIALVWGDRDRIVPVHHGLAALERLECAHFSRYPGCGHFPHLECSERFSHEVARFLDESVAHPRARVRWLPAAPRREGRVRRFFLRLGRALRAALRTRAA